MNNVIDLFKLENKSAFVTGGAKGLGTVINEALLEAGVRELGFCGRGRHGSIEQEEERLKKLFPQCKIIGFKCDISEESQVNEMVQEVKKSFTRMDVLVCNAGVTWAAPSLDQTLKSWHRTLDTNLTGTFLVIRDFAREMLMSNPDPSSIILISSYLAIRGSAEIPQVGYVASKAGLLGLTRQLAVEWAPHIRINAILPSFFEGVDSMAQMFTSEGSPVRDTLLGIIPLRKFIQPNDLKAAICYLSSAASASMTGQSLVLDGGLSVK
ncbi:MAG: SDR family NAD(P)-dependent oxidoreductase [Candidatus Hodarchaeales archaeon]